MLSAHRVRLPSTPDGSAILLSDGPAIGALAGIRVQSVQSSSNFDDLAAVRTQACAAWAVARRRTPPGAD